MRDYANDFIERELPEKRGVEIHQDIDDRVAFFSRHIAKFLFAILLLFFVLTVKAVINAGKDNEQFPVKKVSISGNVVITHPEDVNDALADINKASLLAVDLNEVSERLTALPWIASATATRSWPNTLVVDIVEHKPAYRWGEYELIDAEGHRFARKSLDRFADLPKLSGVKGSEEEVIRAYEFFASQVGGHIDQLEIEQFVKNKYLSWEVRLKSGVLIRFGRNDYVQRVTRFAAALKDNRLPNFNELHALDFRYNSGFAAKWKPEFQRENKDGKLVRVSTKRTI